MTSDLRDGDFVVFTYKGRYQFRAISNCSFQVRRAPKDVGYEYVIKPSCCGCVFGAEELYANANEIKLIWAAD